MASVETARPAPPASPKPSDAPPPRSRRFDWRWALAVAVLLAGALGLRVWGIKQGLPFAYNIDENAHFVPRAIGFFGHTLNPFYFVNPPGYTNLIHVVYAVYFGNGDAVARAMAQNPTEVFVVARATTAVLGTLSVLFLYLAGARMFDRRTGFLAAALLAVSFLPVFYSHLALNDAPTLAPIAVSLWGVAGIVKRGRWVDWVAAGGGMGVAMAVKYTAGIMLVPILVAAALHWWDHGGRLPASWRRALRWGWGVVRTRAFALLVLAGVAAAAGFFVASPYSLLDPREFAGGILHQASASSSEGKLGNTQDNGYLYYLWTMTWGIGWVPTVATFAGAAVLGWRRSRAFWLLVPAALFYFLFMGSAERFFGRWLIPLFPILILLAAVGAWAAVDWLSRRWPRARYAWAAVVALALCGQGLVYSVHNDMVLSRDDTRQLTRDWLDRNLPAGATIVLEPVVPDTWSKMDPGDPVPPTQEGRRYSEFFTVQTADSAGTLAGELAGRALGGAGSDGARELGSRLAVSLLPNQLPRALLPNRRRQDPGVVGGEGYTRDLSPALLDVFRRNGACYVVTGSVQAQRALVDPVRVPEAARFYSALEREAEPVFRASPYKDGKGPVAFNFDWSFDYYPLAYQRPGPEMTVYRLRGGRCGS